VINVSKLKKSGWLIILLIVSLAAAACGFNETKTTQSAQQEETVKITHPQGETVVKKNPQKVVVFDLSALDSLEKLGIKATALPRSVLPPYLDKYKSDEYINVGSLMEPDFEKINSVKPDLIIISGRQAPKYSEFAAIAPTINLQLDQKNYFSSFKANMRQLGLVFDKQEQVEQELKKIDDQVAAIRTKIEKSGNQQALIIMTMGGKMSAYGPGSRFGLIHDVLGMKSALDESPRQQPTDQQSTGQQSPRQQSQQHGSIITNEYIVQKNPDYLFVVDRDDAIGQSASSKQLLNNELINRTKAATNGNIVYLTSSVWYLSGGGLMSMSYMLNEVDQAMH